MKNVYILHYFIYIYIISELILIEWIKIDIKSQYVQILFVIAFNEQKIKGALPRID